MRPVAGQTGTIARTNMNFEIGDLVYHISVAADSDERKLTGRVTGFCPGPEWVRVTTLDGGKHIWLKEHVERMNP